MFSPAVVWRFGVAATLAGIAMLSVDFLPAVGLGLGVVGVAALWRANA